jgi:hypothetical protein
MGKLDDGDAIIDFSIDGTQCPIWEPRPWSVIWSSHKFGGKPGVNYEIMLRLNKPELVWVFGPIPPGKYNDCATFKLKLMQQFPFWKRAVGDDGYRGLDEFISLRNEFDPPELATFKERAMARHENFNQRLKKWQVLTKRFRHGVGNHKTAFRAVCAITLYEIGNGSTSLFDPFPRETREEEEV